MKYITSKLIRAVAIVFVFMLPVSIFAEENYQSHSRVGFYGKYVPLPDEKDTYHNPPEEQEVPQGPIKSGNVNRPYIIPRLGDTTNLLEQNILGIGLMVILLVKQKELKETHYLN